MCCVERVQGYLPAQMASWILIEVKSHIFWVVEHRSIPDEIIPYIFHFPSILVFPNMISGQKTSLTFLQHQQSARIE